MTTPNQDFISVIIPCYNQEHYLKESIQSVIAQSYNNYEIIIVDDGSKDSSGQVAAQFPMVKYIRQDNKGPSAARNRGFRESRGDYLVFLDADDRLLSDALAINLKFLQTHTECAFVSGHYCLIGPDGELLSTWKPPALGDDFYCALLRNNYVGMPSVAMIRRSAFMSVGGFDESIRGQEDYDLFLRIARNLPVCRHEQLIGEYRKHPTNSSGNVAMMLKGTLAVLRSQKPYVAGNKNYVKAYSEGMELWRTYYGEQLNEQLRAYWRSGHQYKELFQGGITLLRYYPKGFARHLLKKLNLFVSQNHNRSS